MGKPMRPWLESLAADVRLGSGRLIPFRSRQELAQLIREPLARMVLGPSDQRDRNDDRWHDRAPFVVGVDRALVLAIFDVPDRQVVARVVLPPGEAHAARAADASRTGD